MPIPSMGLASIFIYMNGWIWFGKCREIYHDNPWHGCYGYGNDCLSFLIYVLNMGKINPFIYLKLVKRCFYWLSKTTEDLQIWRWWICEFFSTITTRRIDWRLKTPHLKLWCLSWKYTIPTVWAPMVFSWCSLGILGDYNPEIPTFFRAYV